ncbi:MAG: hypothetical protein ACK4Q5_19680 [Saprospiraceae bacterium]
MQLATFAPRTIGCTVDGRRWTADGLPFTVAAQICRSKPPTA